jgi:hypothetical protein
MSQKEQLVARVYAQDTCINASCEAGNGPIHDRGLCWACFRNAQLRVNSGMTDMGTWGELEAIGAAAPQLEGRELPERPDDVPPLPPME